MGSNDMQDIGGEPEVYSNEMDPLAYASQQTAKMVAKLKRETALSQTGSIRHLVDQTNVQYDDISRDDQVSNVKGMRFTGDPGTVGQALKYHGDAELQAGQTLDGADIEASFNRASQSMDKASRSALATALQHIGPEALQSLPNSEVAGLNQGVEIAGTGSFAGLVVEATGLLPVRRPTMATPSRSQAAKFPTKAAYQKALVAARKRAIRSQNQSLATAKRKLAPARRSTAQDAREKRELPMRAAQRGQVQAESASAEFVALAAQRHREAAENARKPAATSHPSQSNYEDSQGQANTVNRLQGAEAQRQMRIAMDKVKRELQAVWDRLTPTQRRQAQAALTKAFRRWSKMTPMQRQNAIRNFQQQLRVYVARNQKSRAAGGRQPSVGTGEPPVSSSSDGVTDQLQAAADAQNGNTAAQEEMARNQFQAQEKAKIMAQLTAAWNKATANLTPAQKNQLRSRFIEAQKAWMAMTPAQRRQAIRGFRQQAVLLANVTKTAKAGRTATSAGTAYDNSSNYVDDTGMTSTGEGLMNTYDDITEDSSGYSEAPINPWVIGGAVTLTAIAGGMLFMSGKVK
jgi:hypothetical protein